MFIVENDPNNINKMLNNAMTYRILKVFIILHFNYIIRSRQAKTKLHMNENPHHFTFSRTPRF